MKIVKDNQTFVYFLAIRLVILINEWCAGVFQLAGSHATPATVQVFTALLGDLCSSDAECSIPHSTCISGACICRLNYTQSSDRQNCIATDLNGFYWFYIVFRRNRPVANRLNLWLSLKRSFYWLQDIQNAKNMLEYCKEALANS